MAYEQLRLGRQLCFRLYTASRLVVQAYTPLLSRLGLTYTQYLAMMVLWERDGQLVTEIGRRLQLEMNTISPLIRRLEREGLLTRRTCPTDRRQQIISLTDKGRQLEHQAAEVPGCLLDTIEGCGLSMDDLLPLIPLLDNLNGKMKGDGK